MFELDANNVTPYLRQQGWLDRDEPATASALGWGVSNVVLRVDAAGRSLVVKQSRPQLRTREDWFSDVRRVFREVEVMQVLGALLPAGVVPRVLFEDRDNYAFAMSAVPAQHVVWKELLLAGRVDQRLARLAGDILGTIHAGTAGDEELARRFDDHEVFIQLRVEPFYWRLEPRCPELAGAIAEIVDEMFRTRVCLVHADFSPKNLLVHDGGMTLVDYETGHWGDPAFDLGFFLSHLLLKAVRAGAGRREYLELVRCFWDRYRAQVDGVAHAAFEAGRLTRRSVGHLALCARARIDGTSPVDYLPEEPRRQLVRELSNRLLAQRPDDWEQVLAEVDAALDASGG